MWDVRHKRHQFSHFVTPKKSIKDKGHPSDLPMQAQQGDGDLVSA